MLSGDDEPEREFLSEALGVMLMKGRPRTHSRQPFIRSFSTTCIGTCPVVRSASRLAFQARLSFHSHDRFSETSVAVKCEMKGLKKTKNVAAHIKTSSYSNIRKDSFFVCFSCVFMFDIYSLEWNYNNSPFLDILKTVASMESKPRGFDLNRND